MSGVDRNAVLVRYEALLPRIRTRAELSDLIWEMQGELGTSHAYEMGGDVRIPPQYKRGFLGADYHWDAGRNGYRIETILRGDWLINDNMRLSVRWAYNHDDQQFAYGTTTASWNWPLAITDRKNGPGSVINPCLAASTAAVSPAGGAQSGRRR